MDVFVLLKLLNNSHLSKYKFIDHTLNNHINLLQIIYLDSANRSKRLSACMWFYIYIYIYTHLTFSLKVASLEKCIVVE